MAEEKEKTYDECISELKSLDSKLNKLRKNHSRLEKELDTIATFDNMEKRFGRFGDVVRDSDCDYYLYTRLENTNEEYKIKLSSYDWHKRYWYCDDITFSDLLKRVSFNADNVDDLNKMIKIVTDNITAIVKESENGNHRINNALKEQDECNSEITKVKESKECVYGEAKKLWVLNKYGKDKTLAPYFLKSKNKTETLGLVKVVKKEDSGLGYTVDDIESGRRYYHVSEYRLKEDLRDFPSMDELIGNKKDEE